MIITILNLDIQKMSILQQNTGNNFVSLKLFLWSKNFKFYGLEL